ncbi:unnamed protein product [Didymodactylos carnosus]|uniref:RRM domain-containing protein n=1 Tax=Didymodactylos carnosus TaxID=1234261 RepID=A0A813T439_9BILA|nr:unnamed protein product [Didymodactylos carnosus]CAF0806017.1 unnamed protein product [Didymodactylos carnosus]CAF3550756.1 unnamed protein product [Didymodactylos carnosus]CAF3591429.1 unnamed protein product [Didymodactylos carnosus]
MTSAQAYDYSTYDYGDYNTNPGYPSSAYPSQSAAYSGYDTSTSPYGPTSTSAAAYPAYDGYSTASYPSGSANYSTDPYAGYSSSSAYAPYSSSSSAPVSQPPTQSYSYGSSYGATPYERRTPPLPPSSHHTVYDYSPTTAGGNYVTPSSYKPSLSSTSLYSSHPHPASTSHYPQPTHHSIIPQHQPSHHLQQSSVPAHHIPPTHHQGLHSSHSSSSLYGAPPNGVQTLPQLQPPMTGIYNSNPHLMAIAARRPREYYQSPQQPTIQSQPLPVQQQQQPHPVQLRLPPRGGYQRELDVLHYVVGLPKEIQNETLAGVFAVCGAIAPVDVRSTKPKIWVYKDRQTREGKGEATITFINADSAQAAITYFDDKELFGRRIRVTLCARRLYNMQKQNTPFNKTTTNNNTTTIITTTNDQTTATPISTLPVAASTQMQVPTIIPQQQQLLRLHQTPEQQRGLLPTPPITLGGTPLVPAATLPPQQQRDGPRKELPRIGMNRGTHPHQSGVRPKPY